MNMNTSHITEPPRFVCPRDRGELRRIDDFLACERCRTEYPITNGIPVLIDDDSSCFARSDYVSPDSFEGASYGASSDKTSGLRKLYRRTVSRITETGVPRSSLDAHQAAKLMATERPGGRLLVIGAGERQTYDHPNIVYTDVAFGPLVSCICDAAALPFADGYFDGVLAVAVLEHVADPYKCVDEIRRVLSNGGLVYAETPFLQPVHMGAYDFTRFTYLGHRRLFRYFDDIESGCALGTGASFAYLLPHLLVGLSDARPYWRVAKLVGLLAAFPIKQVDRWILKRRSAYDASAGTYFYGRKRAAPISDREVLRMYRGLQV
jgi:Methyltransferase domain